MQAPKKSKPWAQMSGAEKFSFVCKLTLSIVSFGFIFPNLMND